MRSLLALILLALAPSAFGAVSVVDGKVSPGVGASSASVTAAIAVETASRVAADALRVLKAGDTMTGALTLSSAKLEQTGPASASIYVSSTGSRSRTNFDMPGTGGKVEQYIFRTAASSIRVIMSSNGINMAGLANTFEGDDNRIFPFSGTQAPLAWTSGDGLSSFSLAAEGGAGGQFSFYDESTGNIIWSWQSGAPANSLAVDSGGNAVFGSSVTAGYLSGSGAGLTSLVAANISAGSLGASVVASSVAVQRVFDASIVSVSASKITGVVSYAHAGGFSSTLNAGATFFAFTPDEAIAIKRITATVVVPGVGGAGDTYRCQDSSGNGLSVTVSAAATAGTKTTATGTGDIASGTQVNGLLLTSAAVTSPVVNLLCEYTRQ